MANDIIIPPSVAAGVDALSNLPGPDDAASMFGNDIASDFGGTISGLAVSSGATEITGKISSIIGGSPPAHVGTVAALAPIQTMYTTIITSGAQSADMVTHVGHLQKSMPLVLKKASTANAMVVATQYVSPDCSSNIIFPIGGSGTDATSAVAGTATDSGDVLQGDVITAINNLVTILDAPGFDVGVDSYTIQLNALLDTIRADNGGDYRGDLGPFKVLAEDANIGSPPGLAAIITEKGNTIDDAVLAERANVGLPNLDGSAIIIDGETVVPGVGSPEAGDIQMGAGLVTADIKKKSLGLQAHAMASTPCQKSIITRSAPTDPTKVAGMSSIAAKADAVSMTDENDFSPTDDPTIVVAEKKVVAVEEVDQAAEDTDNIATLDTIVWQSEVQKITALIYNSEEGLTFKANLIIPPQSSAMVDRFPALSTIDTTTLDTEWVYPASMVVTDFFGNNMMKDSLKGQISHVVTDHLYLNLYQKFGSLAKNYGISTFKNHDTKLDGSVLSFIPDPDMANFTISLSMEIGGLDPTTDPNSVGNCKTVIFDGNIKKGVAIGPVEGNDTGFWFVNTHINATTAFTTWIESGDPKLKDAAIKYIDKLTV